MLPGMSLRCFRVINGTLPEYFAQSMAWKHDGAPRSPTKNRPSAGRRRGDDGPARTATAKAPHSVVANLETASLGAPESFRNQRAKRGYIVCN